MPAAGSCTVCEHPDRGLIEAALRAGVPGVRATARQFQLADHNVLSRHRAKHMKDVDGVALTPPKPAEVVQARIAAAAPTQLARVTTALARTRAEQAVDDALTTQGLARELLKVALGEPDKSGKRQPPDVDVATRALKALVDANGGGVQRAVELLAKMTGEIRTGSQTLVLVQDGRVVHPELERVIGVVLEALMPFPEAARAVQAALDGLSASR